MKKGILAFKSMIRFIVSIVTSREMAFCYCVTGTIAQVAHTYFLLQSISSLDGIWRTVQATLLSIFISSSLLYFVSISDDEDSDASRKIHKTITLFTVIEIVINTYYYTRHILIDPLVLNKDPHLTGYFDLVFALMIAVMIPITIKLYAGSIRAKDWLDDIEHEREATVSADLRKNSDYFSGGGTAMFVPEVDIFKDSLAGMSDRLEKLENYDGPITEDDIERVIKPLVDAFNVELQQLQRTNQTVIDEEMIAGLVQKVMSLKINSLDEKLAEAYERNSGLFLKQFENKVKQIMNKGLDNVKNPTELRKQSEDIKDNKQ